MSMGPTGATGIPASDGATGPTGAGATATKPAGRQLTPTELEIRESQQQARHRAARLGIPPKKSDGTTNVIPFSLDPTLRAGNKPVDTGIAEAAAILANAAKAVPLVAAPALNVAGHSVPDEQRGEQHHGANVCRAKQFGTNAPQFDHATALNFYNAILPSAFILGFKSGRNITNSEAFQALAKEADGKHEHLFFHVATVRPTWASGTTATKDQILECPNLWGDCDAEKYAGNDPVEAARHYSDEGLRISQTIDEGLNRLGITPFAKWRSGAGWQFLIKLDQAMTPGEAETLVGKLHTALGFDPVVRNSNRILRVPGSVNWKDSKDGRVPSPCMPLCLVDTVTKIDDVRKALADVKMPIKEAKASEDIKIDWTKVKSTDGWLKSVDDLPVYAPAKLRVIVGHSGNLKELNDQLIVAKLLEKAYPSWSEVTQAATAGFNHCGTLSPEQIAEALLAELPFNQHIAKQKDKNRAIERAINHAHETKRAVSAGVRFRDCTQSGLPKPTLANAVIAIRALGIEASHDLFHHRTKVTYNGEAKTIHEGLLTDHTVSAVRSLINNTYRIDCGDANTLAAINEIAWANAYDPVLDFLDECQSKWDKVKRLDTWVIDYLGCEDTPLNRAIGRNTLIAACRRPRVPGCKHDEITVLEGPEGIEKSTAIRVLAGDENFNDQSILGASDKEVQEQLEGTWMHENADLAGMRRAEVESVKAFARRQVDRARPAYSRVREDRPRRSIEWGSTNNKTYLQSQTGNRSFWPLECGKIKIEALLRDREQLLGEAATYEAAGESTTLDPSLWGEAREAQEQRRVADPWEDILNRMPDSMEVEEARYQTRIVTIIHRAGDGYARVASADVLLYVLKIPAAQQTSAHGQRLAHAMKHIGWNRNKSGLVTINGVPARGYVRPDSALPVGSSLEDKMSSHQRGNIGAQAAIALDGEKPILPDKGCLSGVNPVQVPPAIPQVATGQAAADLALVRKATGRNNQGQRT